MTFNHSLIRQQFPSLDRPAIFLDNPAGTQIARPSLDRMNRYLLEHNANHGGLFETSHKSDEVLHDAHAAMADFLNASRPEEIIFGNNMTTLTLHITSGHTMGTISTLIPVKDRGAPHVAAYWGGTAFNWVANRTAYITPAPWV